MEVSISGAFAVAYSRSVGVVAKDLGRANDGLTIALDEFTQLTWQPRLTAQKKGVNGGYVLIIHIAIPSHRRYERAFEMPALAGQLVTQARVGIARQ